MKRFLKFIFCLLIILILLIGIPVATLYFLVYDGNDEAPIELYNDEITMQSEVDGLFSRFLINRDGVFYLAFSEDDLNRLVLAIIRNGKPEYYAEDCTSDICKNIASAEIPSEIPVIGGKEVQIRHAYTEVGTDNLNFYVTFNAPYIKTKLYLSLKFKKEDGNYIFKIEKLGLGKLNIISGFGKTIAQPLLSQMGFTDEDFNRYFEKEDLPLTFEDSDYSFRFKKEDIGRVVMKLVGDDNPVKNLLKELIAIFSSSENNLLDIGFFNIGNENHFGIKVNLNEIKTDSELSSLLAAKKSLAAQGFDTDHFVTNKTQTFIIGSLSADSQTKITFTNQDFNRIIYSQTNGYSGFEYSLVKDREANFCLTGIFIEFTSELMKFQFVVEINGIESLIEISGDITSNEDESELAVTLRKEMTIGGIQASSAFLLELLGEFDSLSALSYNRQTGTFTISVNTFSELMEVGGPATPLELEKIKAVNGGIEIYVKYTDSELGSKIEQAKEDVKELLKGEFLDESEFDYSEPGQEETIQSIKESLNEISDALNDPEKELESSQTDNLIALINNLSDTNQQILLEQINSNANSSDLQSLYQQLFGN